MTKISLSLILLTALAALLSFGALACGNVDDLQSTPEVREKKVASTEFAVVTPTTVDLPQGWWNPIDEKALEEIEYSLIGIKMWGNCAWYADDPSPSTEAAVRSSLAEVINSPNAAAIGVIAGADLGAVCEGSAAVSEFPVKVDDGRRAAMASEMMIDLLDSCVRFYAAPEAPLAYRIATTFLDMLWMLEQDGPRWPRRDFWGVREWCDNIVEGAVAN
ncbi:MAG: hypothetical protein F4Y63_09220 [Chloroflexi bacterium]|nr:hypothetical protein [Chloroflexota bacterium]MYF79904.1 hypothetical protein [Chloroflexota bacterium]MYK61818.1 hypothetical protein [Chloroflexota bacterium]